MSIVAFLSYVIITSITPGPSNLLMMNEARKFGFLGAWRFNSGILIGFAVLGVVSGIFTTGLYNWVPLLEPYFTIAGAVYLLYLAWKVGLHTSAEKDSHHVQGSFLSGCIFQVLNIKSILFFLTVMSVFVLPFTHSLKSIIFYLVQAIILGWIALLLWAGFGSIFKHLFARYDKSFRLVMSILLIYSAVTIFV